MKSFVLTSAVLATLFIALWVDVIPVRCSVCEEPAFLTDVTAIVFGGHGEVVHENCVHQFAGHLNVDTQPALLELSLEDAEWTWPTGDTETQRTGDVEPFQPVLGFVPK